MSKLRKIAEFQGLAVLALMVACAPSSDLDAESTELAQGLTVLEAQPNLATRIAYKDGDRVIYVETHVGEATPQEYRDADPTLPLRGTDVRISDRHGVPIYTRVSGDITELPESSDEDTLADVTDERAEGRHRDVEIALDALTAAESALAGMGSTYVAESAEVAAIAAVFDEVVAPALEFPEDGNIRAKELSTAAASQAAAAPAAKHWVWLWRAPLKVMGIQIGWHSSTRIADYNSSGYRNVKDQCNHGRCPHQSGMTVACSYMSGNRSNTRIAGHCATAEHFTSAYSHNCNDDSHLQVINIRHNKSYSPWKGECANEEINPGPDGCDPYTW